MATVESVNGPLDLDQLGPTLIHEHFRTTDEAVRFQFPHLYDEDAEWEAAITDARAVAGRGLQRLNSIVAGGSQLGRQSASDIPRSHCQAAVISA